MSELSVQVPLTTWMTNLLFDQLGLLGLEKLFRDALRAYLRAEEKLPELLAERRRLLLKEARQLDLERFYVGLQERLA